CASSSARTEALARRSCGKSAFGTRSSYREASARGEAAGNEGDCVMNRFLFALRVTVKDGERAFVMRNGRFERVLAPGRHRMFDPPRGLAVELFPAVRSEFPADRFAVLKAARPDLCAEMFEPVETKADEVAIVSLDGRPMHLMAPWQTRVFWKVATKV